ncbi:MAG: CehA/McbA family metallohydrolase [Thermoplasmata archaeon]|nr:CehA/McbA family metallohydrolase [Thermoplasmata archaeon]
MMYNLYFGDLHTHTAYSDAWEGTPWDAYQSAIDAGADYMAITDHVSAWNAYSGLAMDPEEWADTLAAADYFTSNKFVAMAGYEAWMLAHLGEINVFNNRELPKEEPLGYKFDRLSDMYDWLAQHPGAIGQFNHPYYMTDDFEEYSYYTETRDSAMNIIEVWNSEFTEDSYVMALDAGWHVMPSVNSDTHNPDWIAGYEMRTVLLAEKLTPENLYAAMSACRGYGTLDKNLRIYYTLNDAIMGSTLESVADTYTVKVHIEDPDGVASDAITKVEVISDGGVVVASMNADSTVVDWEVTLSSEDARYFYIRVTTASNLDGVEGVTAWTAPVWTGL